MTTPLTRRRLLFGAAALGSAATLAACRDGSSAPEDTGSSDDAGDVNLRFAWWGNDVRQSLTQQAISLFEEANPGITVVGESGGFDGYFQKLATQAAAGDSPDMFQMNEWNMREYADRGALLDISAHGFSDDGWPAGSNGTGTVDGKTFGATIGVNLSAVLINPAFFEEAGVEVPDDTTWTWEEFHDVSRELTGASPEGSYGVSFGGGDQISATYFISQLGKFLFEGTSVGDVGAEVGQWFEMWKAMLDDGTLPSATQIAEQLTLTSEQEPFSLGQVGMQIIPANTIVQYESNVGHELALLRIPTQTGATSDLGMWYRASALFCAGAQTAHPEEAVALINFLLNSTEAGEILLADRGVPVNADVLDAIADDLTDTDRRVIDYLEACRPDLVEAPEAPPAGAGAWPSILPRFAQDVIFGAMAPAEAGEAAVQELKNGMPA